MTLLLSSKWARLKWAGNSHISMTGVRLFHHLCRGDQLWWILYCQKLDTLCQQWRRHHATFIRFDTIPPCDGQTDNAAHRIVAACWKHQSHIYLPVSLTTSIFCSSRKSDDRGRLYDIPPKSHATLFMFVVSRMHQPCHFMHLISTHVSLSTLDKLCIDTVRNNENGSSILIVIWSRTNASIKWI